jgi:acetyl-CoA carboxylase biotin carboxyl carrier protein
MTSVAMPTGRDGDVRDLADPVDTAMAEIGAQAALEALVGAVADLVRVAPLPPSRVSVRFGCAAVEIDWPASGTPVTPGAVAGGPADTLPAGTPPAGTPPAEATDNRHAVCAPLVGTFYRSPEPGSRPFVEVGDVVQVGQQVAIVEAMKLMNPIEADVAGRVLEVLVADAAPVEYDQPLLVLEPLEAE